MSASSLASPGNLAWVAAGEILGKPSSTMSPSTNTTATDTTNAAMAEVKDTSTAITQSDNDRRTDDDSALDTDTGLTDDADALIEQASSPEKLPKISLITAQEASLDGNGSDDRAWLSVPLIRVPSNNIVDMKPQLKNNSNIVQINKSPNSDMCSSTKIAKTTTVKTPSNNQAKITSTDLAPPDASTSLKLVSGIKTPLKSHSKDPTIIKSSSSSSHNNNNINNNNTGCLSKPLVINHSPSVVNITNHTQQTIDQLQPLIPSLSSQLIFSSIITTQAKSLASVQVTTPQPRARIAPQQQANLFSPAKMTTLVMSNRSPPSASPSIPSPSPSATTTTGSTLTTTTTTNDQTISNDKTLGIRLASNTTGNLSSNSTTAASAVAAGNAVSAKMLDMGKRLLDAAREGHTDQVRQLVVHSGAPFTSDWLGTTALHLAAQYGHVEIAEILLRGGVNRDARTKLERTALHLAAQGGRLEVVDLLLIHGSDVNVRDMLKMAPLHWAVERGHVAVAERLLFSGADANARSKFQLTPVDIAQNSQSYEMLDLFRNWIHKTSGNNPLVSYVGQGNLNNLGESHELLDVIDFHHPHPAPSCAMNLNSDHANNTVLQRGRNSVELDIDEPSIDLVELEWNSLKFEPDFFLSNDEEDEPNVEYLMKIVEELQKENKQLRQRVEQLSTTSQ